MSNLGVAEVGKGASARSPGHLVVQADVSRVLHLLSSQWLACRVVAVKIYPGVSSEEKTNPTTTLQNSVKGPFRGRRLTIPVWGRWCSSWGRLLSLLRQRSGCKDSPAQLLFLCVFCCRCCCCFWKSCSDPDKQNFFKRQIILLSPSWANIDSGLKRTVKESDLTLSVDKQSSREIWLYVNGFHLEKDTWEPFKDSLYLFKAGSFAFIILVL